MTEKEKQTKRRRNKRAVKTKTLKPGQTGKVERGIFARRDSEGELQYGISYRDKATRKQVRKMVGPTMELARKALAEGRLGVEESEAAPLVDVPTFKEYAMEYLDRITNVEKRAEAPRVQTTLNCVCKQFGKKRLDEITVRDVKKFKDNRRRTCARGTVNRDLHIVKHILAEAADEGLIVASPVAGKKVPFYRLPKRSYHILSEQEERRVYAAAKPWLKPVLRFALNTGMRRSEQLGVQWQDIDWKRRMIHLEKTKTGVPRDVPMNGVVEEILRRQGPEDTGHVFNFDGKPIPGYRVHRTWTKAVKDAGIGHCRWHDLRHTVITRMLIDQGMPQKSVMLIVGHTDPKTTAGYTSPDDDDLHNAMQSIGLYCTSTAHGSI